MNVLPSLSELRAASDRLDAVFAEIKPGIGSQVPQPLAVEKSMSQNVP